LKPSRAIRYEAEHFGRFRRETGSDKAGARTYVGHHRPWHQVRLGHLGVAHVLGEIARADFVPWLCHRGKIGMSGGREVLSPSHAYHHLPGI
jgi:hypothetical protein